MASHTWDDWAKAVGVPQQQFVAALPPPEGKGWYVVVVPDMEQPQCQRYASQEEVVVALQQLLQEAEHAEDLAVYVFCGHRQHLAKSGDGRWHLQGTPVEGKDAANWQEIEVPAGWATAPDGYLGEAVCVLLDAEEEPEVAAAEREADDTALAEFSPNEG